jgi:hypothetical protein
MFRLILTDGNYPPADEADSLVDMTDRCKSEDSDRLLQICQQCSMPWPLNWTLWRLSETVQTVGPNRSWHSRELVRQSQKEWSFQTETRAQYDGYEEYFSLSGTGNSLEKLHVNHAPSFEKGLLYGLPSGHSRLH